MGKSKEEPLGQQLMVKITPDYGKQEHQALALIDRGELQEAESIYRELIAAGMANHVTLCNLAAILVMQERWAEGLDFLRKTIDVNPNYPDAHVNLGVALQAQGDLTTAIASYNKALDLNPSYPEAHYNLGIALKEKCEFTAAIVSYKKALQNRPNYPEAYLNLGVVLLEQGRLSAAVSSCRKAVELEPSWPEAHYNLGVIYLENGELTAALFSYAKALELNPIYPEAHWNQALAILLAGDYEKGLDRYEYRFESESISNILCAIPSCSRWDGKICGSSDKLILVCEQGLGDTLQFMRYVMALRDQGMSVSLCAPTKLHSLIKFSGIDDSPLTPEQGNNITDGQWIPLLSVPRCLQVRPENPIVTEPYIKTSQELIAKWGGILSQEKCHVIGINWQGNPENEKNKINTRERSLHLEAFGPITAHSNVSLLSLQKGFGSEQVETSSFKDRFVRCQDQVNEAWDFLETAAIIANCDLVITSDTAVAHLAGGMGKTIWLLLKKVPEWRWGLEGDTTFWYPSMRLFRQAERGNWDELMERVADELQSCFGVHPNCLFAAEK